MVDTCCGILEKLSEKYDLPFTRPITFNPETSQLGIGGWAVKCLTKTEGGAISKKRQATVFLTYCPFCRKQLREEE